jgi:hypothetical protein
LNMREHSLPLAIEAWLSLLTGMALRLAKPKSSLLAVFRL